MKIDIVVGGSYGDEAKGKISKFLVANNKYDWVCRASGGPNAGHTIYHNGKKFITHHIPSGVFHNIQSVIGAGCVINPKSLFTEIKELEDQKIDVFSNLNIAYNAHIITDEHVSFDVKTDTIGSTGRGIMPAYRDKYARVGMRAEDVPELKSFLIDTVDSLDGDILIEGAQGYNLCPDWGKYPYVTSSPPTATYALHSLGLPAQAVSKVWLAMKVYDTYVGTRQFQPSDEIFNQICSVGNEFGSTTGRARKCNWLNLSSMIKAAKANGATDVVFSKVDVLEKLKRFAIIEPDIEFYTMKEMQEFIEDELSVLNSNIVVHWSSSKEFV